MNVLFLPWGQPTHYFHMVPLAWAFRAAGHNVRVASQPGAATAVKNSGLTVSSIGHGYNFQPDTSKADNDHRRNSQLLQKALLHQQLDDYGAGPVLSVEEHKLLNAGLKKPAFEWLTPYIRVAEAMAGELTELARGWRPDLVIADPFVLAAPLAAAQTGAPLIHHLWGPAVHRRVGVFPGSGMPVEAWPDDLRQLFGTYGVEARAEHAAGTIDMCPASIQYPLVPDRIPCRFVPYNGPGEAPPWLLEPPDRPRICITWGTRTTTTAGAESFLVPRILDALAALGTEVEAVITVTADDRALLPDPAPKNVRIIEQLPLHLLLPTCTAVIHQGGAGTMLTAAALGVPQIVVSGLLDQQLNARRLVRTDAAVTLDWADASIEAIVVAVVTTLTDRSRRAARRLQQEIAAQPPPADVVTLLCQLA